MNTQIQTGVVSSGKIKPESLMKQQVKTGPIMAALLVAGFVGLFSETALNIALGQLSEIFAVHATTIQWLATGYFLTLGILVPVTGILMQKFSTRQMFFTSISLSIIGTVIAAAASVFPVLLAGRIIQAAGLAINLPLTQNVIFTIFPPNKRGAAMGVMGLVMLAGPALGPTVAGLILDTLSCHWIFWVTIPFLLFSLLFGMVFVPNVNDVRPVSIDAASVILSTIGFGGVVYGVSAGGEHAGFIINQKTTGLVVREKHGDGSTASIGFPNAFKKKHRVRPRASTGNMNNLGESKIYKEYGQLII